jgi:hypothetical protein
LREDVVARLFGKSKVERSDGGEGEGRKEIGDSGRSRSRGFGKIVEVDGLVEVRGREVKEGDGSRAESGERKKVSVGGRPRGTARARSEDKV